MTSTSWRPRFFVAFIASGVLALACGDSGHPLGQSNGGAGGAAVGTGGSSGGSVGTGGGGGRGGSAGTTGLAGHGGSAGTSGLGGVAGGTGTGGTGGTSTGGTGGGAGHGAGGAATGGAGGKGGLGGSGTGGTSPGGAGGQAGQGAGGAGGATVCSSLPLVPCASNEVCDYNTPSRCGAGYEPGQCIVLPTSCPTTSSPVCGCNGTTYNNDCDRQYAREQLDHTGACTGAGGTGGSGGANCGTLTCDSSQTYCNSYTGGTAGSVPVLTCVATPSACVANPTCTCLCSSGVSCTAASGCSCTESNGLVMLTCFGT